MKTSRYVLLPIAALVVVAIACSGSRDVVGGQEPVAQSVGESASEESGTSTIQASPTNTPEPAETLAVEVIDVASYTSSIDSL